MVRFCQDPIKRSGTRCVDEGAKFKGFTEEALEAIMLARDESRRLGLDYIGIEQILLGLIGQGTRIAAQLGIKLKDARQQVEMISPRDNRCYALGLPFTSTATSALLHSFEEAWKRGHDHVGPQHLLLVLLRQRLLRRVINDLGADSSNIYTQVVHMVGGDDELSIVNQGSTGNGKMPTLGANLTKLVGERVGATTLDEYKEHIEKAPTLAMPSLRVEAPELSVDEIILILKRVQKHYEIHHKLRYSDEALISAAELSYQYISDRFLPGKAIELIDEAGACVCARHAQFLEEIKPWDVIFTNEEEYEKSWEFCDREDKLCFQTSIFHEVNKAEKVVTEADIQDIISSWTGIPVEKVITDESDRLVKIEETLHKRVIGQDEAVRAVSRTCACACLRMPKRPIASFFFYGPHGVGKSELAKALAANYFGSEEAIIRIDLTEFDPPGAVSRLIGSHPGYSKGGQLTEVVWRRPYSVVIFDGIYSSPDILNMILEIVKSGWFVDGKVRIVDFSNTIVIVTCTSVTEVEEGLLKMGFDLDQDCPYSKIKSLVIEYMERRFAPIMNIFDDVIVFRQLTKLEVKEIAGVMLKGVSHRLKAKGIQLHVTERFRERVVDKGYKESVRHKIYGTAGAWPLCRAIRHLEDIVTEKMVAGEIKEDDSVTADADSGSNSVILSSTTASL
ncbi:hypothetical protein V6N12_047308 [Hibiscus sabdariffa]|uniref:Clp R domain-containing protein n=1 Tax=Hibiscus sabdariffa TaxID=183260 RepID=A0ABR2DAH9_9ROSI